MRLCFVVARTATNLLRHKHNLGSLNSLLDILRREGGKVLWFIKVATTICGYDVEAYDQHSI